MGRRDQVSDRGCIIMEEKETEEQKEKKDLKIVSLGPEPGGQGPRRRGRTGGGGKRPVLIRDTANGRLSSVIGRPPEITTTESKLLPLFPTTARVGGGFFFRTKHLLSEGSCFSSASSCQKRRGEIETK